MEAKWGVWFSVVFYERQNPWFHNLLLNQFSEIGSVYCPFSELPAPQVSTSTGMGAALSPPSPDQSTEPGQWRASQMYQGLGF